MANPVVTSAGFKRDVRNFAAMVRLFMRDYPELNRLIEGKETNERMMVFAVLDALDDFNQTPPLLGEFPIRSVPGSLLKLGAVVHILMSVGLLQARNHIDVSDGGIQVGVSNKSPLLQSWLQLFLNQWEQKKQHLKVAWNIENAYGYGVASEYSNLGYWYGDFAQNWQLN